MAGRRFEPVAVIGIGCRFGDATDPESFWKLLCNGEDAVRELPPERFDSASVYDPSPGVPGKTVSRWGAWLSGIDQFDAGFFGISPREAAKLDPQQRLLLEVCWEALEDAGIVPDELVGSATGVFVGLSYGDYEDLAIRDRSTVDIYTNTGGFRGVAAGRISYALGLEGPSVAVDTACSSSLTAVHLALQSLQSGESTLALTGGANVILHPAFSVGFSGANMLSPEGRCKFASATADGFVRSEGVGIVALKPLRKARDDGDPVYAVIQGSAANNDGSSGGLLMAPSRRGQECLLRTAYRTAAMSPTAVQYVEAHGTGTRVGDPIELGALGAVLGAGRAQENPLWVGSVKTNIGHTEAAAGVAGLIKTALALQHGSIPASLHCQPLTPEVPWSTAGIRVASRRRAWPKRKGAAAAGVCSFGIGGSNVHIVLSRAASRRGQGPDRREGFLLPISARSRAALHELAWKYSRFLEGGSSVAAVCYSASVRRMHHCERMAVLCDREERLPEALREFVEGGAPPEVIVPASSDQVCRSAVAFVFSGQGSQWDGMGRSLFEQESVFRRSLQRTSTRVERELGWRVEDELYGELGRARLERVDVVQPCIFAIQVALAELWESWGVKPYAVIGHSMGEVAAARVAGILSLADATRIVCQRSRIVQERSPRGRMAVVELPAEEARRWIRRLGRRLTVAAQNGAQESVVAGDPSAIDQLCTDLEAAGVFSRQIKVNYASHSSHMDSLLEPLGYAIGRVRPNDGRALFYSTVTGQIVAGRRLTARYWKRNLRAPVLFGATLNELIEGGCRTLVEISPHPVLLSAMREQFTTGRPGTAIGSLRREQPARPSLLEGLGQLYVNGASVNWRGLYGRGRRFERLPTYAWQRSRYWMEEREAGGNGGSRRRTLRSSEGACAAHPLLENYLRPCRERGAQYWELAVGDSMPARLADHRVGETPVFPAAAFAEMALAAAAEAFGEGPHAIEAMRLERMLSVPNSGRRWLQLAMCPALGRTVSVRFASSDDEAGSEWTVHAAGSIRLASPKPPPRAALDLARLRKDAAGEVSGAEHYAAMRRRGLVYGEAFRGIERLWSRGHEVVAKIGVPKSIAWEVSAYRIHPAVLDAGLQALLAAVPGPADVTFLPVSVQRLRVFDGVKGTAWAHATLRDPRPNNWRSVVGDVRLYGDDGALLAEAEGVELHALELSPRVRTGSRLYELVWRPVERRELTSGRRRPSGLWLIVNDEREIGAAVGGELRSRGERCLLVNPRVGVAAELRDGGERQPGGFPDWDRVLEDACAAGNKILGVVYTAGIVDPIAGPSPHGPVGARPSRASASAAQLVRALVGRREALAGALWLVTRRAQVLASEAGPVAALQAPLWGLGSVVAQEHPDLRCIRIDVDAADARSLASLLCDELLGAPGEDEVLLRSYGRYVRRLVNMPVPDAGRVRKAPKRAESGDCPFAVEVERPGSLENLRIRRGERKPPEPDQIEVQVSHVGLNFRDVLMTLGVIGNSDAIDLGSECVGTVTAVGQESGGFKHGDEVIAVGRGCLRRFSRVSADCCSAIPKGIEPAAAATIGLAFLTAYYSLHDVARVGEGDRILIHAATGGVGLAAVQLAQRAGAEIFATVGSEEKRAFLCAMGVSQVFGSRSLDFADEILEATRGEGVDIVLNSLAGEGIQKGLEVLRPFGRFLELGKRDVFENSQIPLAALRRNLSFHLIDLESMILSHPDRVHRLLSNLLPLFASGELRPLPYTEFSVSAVPSAFKHLGEAKHIGKVVVNLVDAGVEIEQREELVRLSSGGTHVITGGLGGLGGQLARWLVEGGARDLALISRSGPTDAAKAWIGALERAGARVRVLCGDVADPAQVDRCLDEIRRAMPPIRGVFHAAGVLDDGVVAQLDAARFERVMSPKIEGARNLDRATKDDPIEWFVLFSSAAGVLGTSGQGNYAAANAFLDALAQDRTRRGLPALSVDWGPWERVGLAAQRASRGRRLEARGLGSLSPEEALDALGVLLTAGATQACVMRFDAPKWIASYPAAADSALLKELAKGGASCGSTDVSNKFRRGTVEFRDALERRDHVEALVRSEVARVLRLPSDRLERGTALKEFGLDSLMAVELRNRLAAQLGLRLSATLLFNHPTLEALIEHLNVRLGREVEAATEGESPREPVDAVPVTEYETRHGLRQKGVGAGTTRRQAKRMMRNE